MTDARCLASALTQHGYNYSLCGLTDDMLKSLRLSALTQFFDRARGAAEGAPDKAEEEYLPLAPTEEDAPLEETGEMGGFDEQFEKPEERDGDALAQIVAAVCQDFLAFNWGCSYFCIAVHCCMFHHPCRQLHISE